jgi:predicted RNA binding protein YcfA (HicA-like mRNA interferase family)
LPSGCDEKLGRLEALLLWERPGRRRLKVRDLIRLVESNGWRHLRTTGSHRHFIHPSMPMVVTVPGHLNDDLPAGTLKSVLRKAGLEEKAQ